MPYIPPEVVEQARQIDLLTYLQSCEPQELVRISGNNYTTRTHDSLKISNGKWMWWSQRIGGYNALDYLVKVKGCSFVEAVETLMGKAAVMPSMTVKPQQKTEPKVLLLPDKSASTERITEYLFGRGIDYAIIQHCIDKGLIFESLHYLFKEDLMKIDELTKQVTLLGKHHIGTDEQLFSYQHSVEEQIKTLTAGRTHLRNEIRKVNITDAELSQAKASISLLSEKLKELRKEVKLCQDIAARSKVIEEKVDAVRAEEEKSKRKENRNYEQRR